MEGRSVADAIRSLRDAGLGAASRMRIFGLRGSAPGFFVARFATTEPRPSVVVAPTLKQAEDWLRALRFFLGEEEATAPLERRVHWMPPWDAEPLATVSPTEEIVAERLSTL